jgi:hypothetical protein
MSGLVHDLRLALRTLASRWRFFLLVIATMAIGIGTTVGVWAYLAYFVRPTLDAPDPGRLVRLSNPAPDDRFRRFDLADWRDLEPVGCELFTGAAASRIYSASLQNEDTILHVFGTAVSGEYFQLLGARPALGRLLEPRDDRLDADPVLVLSDLTWRRHFGGGPGVVGRTLSMDGRHPYTISPPTFSRSYDIRTIQELLGHKDVSTTMIYCHALNRGGRGVRSPLDRPN